MEPHSRRGLKKTAAWGIAGIFVLGLFVAPIGAFTGPVTGAWFAGTQRPRRGFAWMLGFAALLSLPHWWRGWPHHGGGAMVAYAEWALLGMILGVLPFTLHRLTGPRWAGFSGTLGLPVFAVVLAALQAAWLPAGSATLYRESSIMALPRLSALLGRGMTVFLVYWFAATLVWAWNQEFRGIRAGVSTFFAVCVLAAAFEWFGGNFVEASESLAKNAVLDRVCFAAAAVLVLWPLLAAFKERGWRCRPSTRAILQSPGTGEPLELVKEGRGEALASASGERFPIHGDIPDMRRAQDLTGANEKYNHLYEFMGGFYDDVQRIGCALMGIDRDAYVMSYLGLLEVKPGDSVLETSVGTGLNFKYLPPGVSLTGIDLSPEMLTSCQANLRRRHLSADLFLGNAECLPFADSSFDVVFHVGGINFFNDRGRAIEEMIRVARPGSRILIADETEEHVKAAYERGPVTSGYYKDRREAVRAPIDLVPAEMLETRLEVLNVVGKNRFYVLTFRKPVPGDSPGRCAVTEFAATALSERL